MSLKPFNHVKRSSQSLKTLIVSVVLSVLLSSCTVTPSGNVESSTPTIKHIVLISIDGLRPDAINKDNAKNLYQLSRGGLYYPKAKTIQRSVTLPSHISMLTGLGVAQHKITQNESLPGYIAFPTILQLAKLQGKKTAAFYSKKKLTYLFPPDSIDYAFGPGQNNIKYHQTNADQLATEFTRQWQKQGFHLTFVHIREPDMYGHKFRWMSDEYLHQAVPLADQAIGKIVSSIRNSPQADSTLIIITSDHGGKDKSHWHGLQEELTIPWIAIHPGLPPETLTNTSVSIADTAPTILHILGIPIPADIDGRVIQRFK